MSHEPEGKGDAYRMYSIARSSDTRSGNVDADKAASSSKKHVRAKRTAPQPQTGVTLRYRLSV
eukprot:691052-Pleurochrysis_carterae.AAC.3